MSVIQCDSCQSELYGSAGGIFRCSRCGKEFSADWVRARLNAPPQKRVTIRAADIDIMLRRGVLALEAGSWSGAAACFRRRLDENEACAQAHLGLLMASLQCRTRAELAAHTASFAQNEHYVNALRYGDEALRAELEGYCRAAPPREPESAGYGAPPASDPLEPRPPLITPPLVERQEAAGGTEPAPGRADSVIAAGYFHTVAVRRDGGIVDSDGSAGYDEQWKNLVAVAAGFSHTVGLRRDGTVVAAGQNSEHECDVREWRDIVAISAGHSHTLGLRQDGTVVAAGRNAEKQCNVAGWRDIVAVAAGYYHSLGLRRDGSVVAAGGNDSGQCAFPSEQFAAIATARDHSVGLRRDGTVLAVGKNDNGQCDVDGWTDITAISVGNFHTVGLRRDGTVVAAGKNGHQECEVSAWTDIAAISANFTHTVAVRSNGTAVAAGKNELDKCSVGDWAELLLPAQG